MIKHIFFLFSLFCLSCSSDNIIRSEKTDFYNIYKDIIIRGPVPSLEGEKKEQKVYNREWLSKFNQPIILLSSLVWRVSSAWQLSINFVVFSVTFKIFESLFCSDFTEQENLSCSY